jgi:DNA helicase HerA-like ATPase
VTAGEEFGAMNDMSGGFAAARPASPAEVPVAAAAAQGAAIDNSRDPIGVVLEIAGSGSNIALDLQRLQECTADDDPSIALAGQVGSQIKIRVGNGWLLASVRTQRQDSKTPGGILAAIDFLGEGDEERLTGRIHGFRRGVTRYPIPGALIYPATSNDLKQIYASDGRANVQIGTVFPTRDIRAGLYIDAMLGKHFALLGSTGTGKSTSAALILHRICEAAPEGHIVMIDPHGEYSAAFKQTGQIFDVSNLQMPYWLMNFEEHCEVFLTTSGNDRQEDADILAKCLLQARGKNRLAETMGKITVDSPIPYLLSDLSNAIQTEMGKLDKAGSSAPYMRVKGKIDEIKADPRYQFMFSGMLVGDTMGEFIGKIFRLPSRGKPISIIDVSGVPSDITSTVVAVLSRLIFDFAIWARDEKTRPILLVCEEAHRYVPNEKNSDGSSVGRILSRIAKEGRKYGISLGLITQRPSDLAEGVLSQCGTIISMRLNNDRDQAFVKAAMPEGARGFLDSIPALRNRECIICGEGVSIPIRVAFDNLEEMKRPASEDPSFSELWNNAGGEEDMVTRTVQRWRAQGR